jgi:hypothetical protein
VRSNTIGVVGRIPGQEHPAGLDLSNYNFGC